MSESTGPVPNYDGNTLHDDRRLVRAVLRRWPIPDQFKEAIIRRLMTIAVDSKSKPRDATRAAQAVIAAEKQNQEDEPGKAPLVHVSFAIDQAIERELARVAGTSQSEATPQIAETAERAVAGETGEANNEWQGAALPNGADGATGGFPAS